LLEFKKLARAYFSLKPSSVFPAVEFHPIDGEMQLVARRGDSVIALHIRASFQLPPMSLPFSMLDVGSRKGDVQICGFGDTNEKVTLSWTDQNVPQRVTYVAALSPEPLTPTELSPVDARLITAFADAYGVTDSDSKRYALQCVQCDGSAGTVTATDGRQLLRHQGFRFPWAGESILIPGNRVFVAPELRRQKNVACTLEDQTLVIAAGPWRLWFPLETDARFPEVASILPNVAEATNRVCFETFDLDFLARNLRYLPGAKRNNSPVTLDLNGHVDVAGDKPDDNALPMRIRLNRSTNLGSDNRLLTNRDYLQRAAKLGLVEMFAFEHGRPLLCRGENLTYLWQPLHREPTGEETRDPQEVLVESLPSVR
jgi:hypothetical protein